MIVVVVIIVSVTVHADVETGGIYVLIRSTGGAVRGLDWKAKPPMVPCSRNSLDTRSIS